MGPLWDGALSGLWKVLQNCLPPAAATVGVHADARRHQPGSRGENEAAESFPCDGRTAGERIQPPWMEAVEVEGRCHRSLPQPTQANAGPCFGATAQDCRAMQPPRIPAPRIQFPWSDGNCPYAFEMRRRVSALPRLVVWSSHCFVLLAGISIQEYESPFSSGNKNQMGCPVSWKQKAIS